MSFSGAEGKGGRTGTSAGETISAASSSQPISGAGATNREEDEDELMMEAPPIPNGPIRPFGVGKKPSSSGAGTSRSGRTRSPAFSIDVPHYTRPPSRSVSRSTTPAHVKVEVETDDELSLEPTPAASVSEGKKPMSTFEGVIITRDPSPVRIRLLLPHSARN
jgi:hypothetical protein